MTDVGAPEIYGLVALVLLMVLPLVENLFQLNILAMVVMTPT
jgi:hypothetical protein